MPKKSKTINVPIEAVDEDIPELVDIESGLDGLELPPLIDDVSEEGETTGVLEEDDDVQMKELKPIKEVKRKRRREDRMDVDETDTKKEKPTVEMRKVPVPPHRYGQLKENWVKIITPIVKQLGLQVRFNLKSRNIEIRCPENYDNKTNLQKATEFVKAFILGFTVDDALALIRLDHLFLETFEINDVKPLKGDHLSRAIGRIAGKEGRTKFTIENVTKTRIVLADSKIHLLGSYQSIQVARNAICSLILGSPPNKVYGNLRTLSSRLAERL